MTQHEHRSKFKTRWRCNKPHDSYGNSFEKKASLSTKSQLETRRQINVIAGLLKLRETIFCFRQFKISWTQNQYNLLFNVKRHMSSCCLPFESYIKYDICLRYLKSVVHHDFIRTAKSWEVKRNRKQYSLLSIPLEENWNQSKNLHCKCKMHIQIRRIRVKSLSMQYF